MEFKDFKRKVQTRQFAIDCSGRGNNTSAKLDSGKPVESKRRQLEEELAQANGCQVFGLDMPYHSNRKKIGKLIVFCKRAVRKLIKVCFGWYLLPIFKRQSHFNGKILNAVALERELMQEYQERLQLLDNLDDVKAQINALTESLNQARKERDSAFKAIDEKREEAIQALSVKNEETLHVLTAMNMETARQFATENTALKQLCNELQDELVNLQKHMNDSFAGLTDNQEQIRLDIKNLANLPTDDDDFYHAFEEKFRGSREDIKNRLQVYVPLIKEYLPDWSQGRFVDIGSGRGEWLDILRDNGAEDRIGIDLNQRQNAICESHGHKTLCMDAIEYLSQQPDNSLDLVSGIQIIEHLSLPTLMELLQQCHRALKPGGMILFETPNPRNLMVGADTFYMDLSHKRPLEPGVVDFMAEWSGFGSRKMIEANSHPMWEGVPLVQGDSDYELKRQFNDIKWLLYGPQDYALFAVKE